MKTSLLVVASIVGITLGNHAHSQAPAAAQTSLQRLQSMKTLNQQMLERQAQTLKLLDAMQLEAQQLKFLGKRS